MEKLTKVRFTNLDKILYPDLKITKSKIIEYYVKIAPKILKFLEERPLVITRYPDGVDKKGFYAKDAPKGTPPWIETFKKYSKTAKRYLDYIICNNLDTLLWLANLAALEIHIPLSKRGSYHQPDLILFDIDPEPPADINDAIQVAKQLKKILDDLSLVSYVKTSGKKGFHIVVPIIPKNTYKQTRNFVHQIGKNLAKQNKMVVSEFSHSQDPGTVYLDYGQNSTGKTMICPYSLRATKNASVSFPLAWDDLRKELKPESFNIFSVINIINNPWKGILENKQKLEGK
jgi:bifunctional non-homologous end joining protein LigD